LFLAVACAGACGTIAASLIVGDSLRKAFAITLVAGGAAAAVGLLALIILQLTRRRSVALQGAIVALTPVGAVGAGAMAASHLMMEATRPVAALGVVLISSGTVGILASLALSARLRAGSAHLIDVARQIGAGDLKTPVRPAAGEEFEALARELEAMQSQLDTSRARERSLEEARQKLVAWVSHDLRTPLTRLTAIVEALSDGIVSDPDEVAAYHDQLGAECKRLSNLVNDLFELNRIAAGALALEVERVDVSKLVAEVVATFAVVAQARRISLVLAEPSAVAEADLSPRHFERAVSNVVENALRYTNDGGAVQVSVTTKREHAIVAVDDSCGGADVERLRRLLVADRDRDAFVTTASSGLGLPIARGLVEAQSGRIGVERTNGGCRFTLTVPLVPSDGANEDQRFDFRMAEAGTVRHS
jgi:signal transduction histidine kinase